ncbi:MAG TPA: septal ring lytic transglycosylase RlpA family protein [Solirubrobacteraceae bacterium]
MMPRTLRQSVAVLVCLTGVLIGALPAAAANNSGGVASGSAPSSPQTGGSTSIPTAEPPIILSAGALTLRTSSAALEGHTLAFAGQAPARDARRTITIERYDKSTGNWIAAASAPINAHGAFRVNWRTNLAGRVSVRALVLQGAHARAAASENSDSSQAAEITIYRPAIATYFGTGFYGQKTACGQTLKPQVIGVANRTLPCGTLIEVSYAARRLTLPVIDRGPYANGASWDLTEAAARSLDIAETVRIGTLVVGATANVPTLGLSPQALETEAQAALTGGSAP